MSAKSPVVNKIPVSNPIHVELPFENVPYEFEGQLIVGFKMVIPFPIKDVAIVSGSPPWLEIDS